MYVKNKMTTDVITIFKEASIDLAFQTMVEKGCKQLPVIEDNLFLGMLTEQLLSEVTPSKATSLNVYELNYLLSKTKVKDVMATDVPTGHPDMLLEEAASLMRSSQVDALPIINSEKHLMGIITRSDILDAFLELTGILDYGTRISLEISSESGSLAELATLIKDHGINIIHIANYNHIGQDNHSEMVIRLATLDVDTLLQSFNTKGYTVLNVRKNTAST